MLVSRSSPFGSPTRTGALVALRLLEQSYPREIARLLDQPLFAVQRALAGLERDGLVVAVRTGRTRVYRIDPRYFAFGELWSFLGRLSEADPALQAEIAELRRRPRRTGKRL